MRFKFRCLFLPVYFNLDTSKLQNPSRKQSVSRSLKHLFNSSNKFVKTLKRFEKKALSEQSLALCLCLLSQKHPKMELSHVSCLQGRLPGCCLLPQGQFAGDGRGPDPHRGSGRLIQQLPHAGLPVVHQGTALRILKQRRSRVHFYTIFIFHGLFKCVFAVVVHVGGRAVAQAEHAGVHVFVLYPAGQAQDADGRQPAAGQADNAAAALKKAKKKL